MSSLKAELKKAAALFKENKNDKVLEILEPLIEEGVADYMLFCFAALANFNLEEYEEASDFFKKAVELDSSKQDAWKGAFKILEKDWKSVANEFGLQVCDNIISTSDDKAESAKKLKRSILFELKKWEVLMEDIGEDKDFLHFVVESFVDRENLSVLERLLLSTVFMKLLDRNEIESNAVVYLSYCKFSATEKPSELMTLLDGLCKTHGEMRQNSWVEQAILLNVCETYFCISQIPPVSVHISDSSVISEKVRSLISSLRENDITSALEFTDQLGNEEKNHIILCVCWISYCSHMPKLGRSVQSSSKSLVKLQTPRWKITSTAGKLGQVKIAISLSETAKLDDLTASFPVDSRENLQIRILTSNLNDLSDSEKVALAEKLASHLEADWQDLLLAAETKISAKLDATSLLVKAAKLNPRSSRVFHVLGRTLVTKNPAKAKSCLERAVRIRPSNEEYVRELDQLLEKSEAPANERLAHLKRFVALRGHIRPLWLGEKFAELYLKTGNLDGAIEEFQQLVRTNAENKRAWGNLAMCYYKKGHLRASVNSYEHLSKLDSGMGYNIPLMNILIELGDYELALEKVGTLNEAQDPKFHLEAVTLEARIHLSMMDTKHGEERREHLKKALKLLGEAINSRPDLSLIYKLAGDALMKVFEFDERFFKEFEINEEWKVSDRNSCINTAISFYGAVLERNKESAQAWHDVAAALLTLSSLNRDGKLIEKAKSCLKHALRLTNDPKFLAIFWTLMAEAIRLENGSPARQQHCLVRALQLCKTHDPAWLQLAVLYFSQGEIDEAHRAFEQTIKHNPQNGAAWCGWAMHAEAKMAFHEARAMFRQALTIKPTNAAIIGYAQHLAKSLKDSRHRFDPATEAIEFEPILDIREKADCDPNTRYHLGVLCELFGYFAEAVECFKMSQAPAEDLERAKIKLSLISPTSSTSPCSESEENAKLRNLAQLDAPTIREHLKTQSQVYGDLLKFIEDGNVVGFGELYLKCFKAISTPLLVSAIIAFKMELPDKIVAMLHDALPRQELIDVFPTVLPPDMDNGLRHLEQDGEVPFRYRHRVAKDLFELLKNRREVYEANRKPSTPIPADENDEVEDN
ncbi:unnamed protein product [Caenorhabditis auriculariae]|uniref:Uncharacterized protein n=1 Tax=Caenorhabditis auriculariae TaxID=2777116 RepID=A0A8S1HNR6_9PELO|nr:unnamed protein product [Caenorhabditis auriculariae]